MATTDFCFHKAEQCARLAKAATNPDRRSSLEAERKAWLEIAADAASREQPTVKLQQ
jgi:hypothetical protein